MINLKLFGVRLYGTNIVKEKFLTSQGQGNLDGHQYGGVL